jgi:hypothetical protein
MTRPGSRMTSAAIVLGRHGHLKRRRQAKCRKWSGFETRKSAIGGSDQCRVLDTARLYPAHGSQRHERGRRTRSYGNRLTGSRQAELSSHGRAGRHREAEEALRRQPQARAAQGRRGAARWLAKRKMLIMLERRPFYTRLLLKNARRSTISARGRLWRLKTPWRNLLQTR